MLDDCCVNTTVYSVSDVTDKESIHDNIKTSEVSKISKSISEAFPNTFNHRPSISSFTNKNYFDVLSIDDQDEQEVYLEDGMENGYDCVCGKL